MYIGTRGPGEPDRTDRPADGLLENDTAERGLRPASATTGRKRKSQPAGVAGLAGRKHRTRRRGRMAGVRGS